MLCMLGFVQHKTIHSSWPGALRVRMLFWLAFAEDGGDTPHPSSGVRPMLVSMQTPSLMAHTLAPAPAGRAAAINRPPVPTAAAAVLSKPPVPAPGKWAHSLPATQHLAKTGTASGPKTFLMSVDRGDKQAGLHLCGTL